MTLASGTAMLPESEAAAAIPNHGTRPGGICLRAGIFLKIYLRAYSKLQNS